MDPKNCILDTVLKRHFGVFSSIKEGRPFYKIPDCLSGLDGTLLWQEYHFFSNLHAFYSRPYMQITPGANLLWFSIVFFHRGSWLVSAGANPTLSPGFNLFARLVCKPIGDIRKAPINIFCQVAFVAVRLMYYRLTMLLNYLEVPRASWLTVTCGPTCSKV